jgi:L-rhamnose mutarotase
LSNFTFCTQPDTLIAIMQRVGFLLKVRTERLAEYLRLHNPIWPELANDLRAAGMRNYTLWLAPDGTEFGYLECDDWNAVCAKLAKSDVHTKWQELMQNFLETPRSAGEGGQPVLMLEQVFDLDKC